MPSYAELLRRVSEGTLSLTFILGLPRGGTTAIEKHIYSRLPFDANVNEPSLHLDIGTPASNPDERADMTFHEVLKVVEQIEAQIKAKGERSLLEHPLRILVKEVTNKVLPGMIHYWSKLSVAILVIFREPSLQLESRLKSIVDRVSSGALKQFGITDDLPAEELVVHGKHVMTIEKNSLPSGINLPARPKPEPESANVQVGADGNAASFKSAWQGMVKRRDFSDLGDGLPRLSILHPFCADKESQQIIWGKDAPRPSPGLADFESLSDELCSRMLSWRLGWTPLRQHMQKLDEEKHPHVMLLDFSCFQIAPALLTSAVNELHAGCKGWEESLQALQESGKRAEDFELQTDGWKEEDWQAWYGVPCYAKVSKREDVEPVLKAPAPASKFPQSCQSCLRDALNLYSELSNDPRAARPAADMFTPFTGIDTLFDAMWDLESTSSSRVAAIDCFMVDKEIGTKTSTSVDKSTVLRNIFSLSALVCIQAVLLLLHAFVYLVHHLHGRVSALVGQGKQNSDVALPISNDDEPVVISVIIPCYNEESFIATTLHSVCSADAAREGGPVRIEIIVVVDTSSDDLTASIVDRLAASEDFPFPIRRVVAVDSGRGPTICAGIREARGHALMFLHADCVLPQSWDTVAIQALRKTDVHAAAFKFQLGHPRVADGLTDPWRKAGAQLLESAVFLRSSLLQVPFGDQAIIITSAQLVALGGFPPYPIFEDYTLVMRLLKSGGRTGRWIKIIEVPCGCAARRFEEKGLWRFGFVNFYLILAYFCGVSTETIFRLYYGRSLETVKAGR